MIPPRRLPRQIPFEWLSSTPRASTLVEGDGDLGGAVRRWFGDVVVEKAALMV